MDRIGSFCVCVCVCVCVRACVRARTCKHVSLLCVFFINRCQCGATVAGQSVAANVTNMVEKKEKESS